MWFCDSAHRKPDSHIFFGISQYPPNLISFLAPMPSLVILYPATQPNSTRKKKKKISFAYPILLQLPPNPIPFLAPTPSLVILYPATQQNSTRKKTKFLFNLDLPSS